MKHRQAIAAALLAHSPPPRFRKLRADELPGRGKFPNGPLAFLLGVIFDRMVKAEAAWAAPVELERRLGHLDAARIALLDPERLEPFVGRWRGGNSLHRFVPTMSRNVVLACRRVVDEYDGDVANIWANATDARDVIDRLLAFAGISEKLAMMATKLLVTDHGVRLAGWNQIDMPVDRHIARVFLRTGMVAREGTERDYSAAELKAEIVAIARKLSPAFPAALDLPAFYVGTGWCNAGRAWCSDGDEPCPLLGACPSGRQSWEIK